MCAHPINDGTDRLRTKSHDCPKGELRQVPKGLVKPLAGSRGGGRSVQGFVHLTDRSTTKLHDCPEGELRQVLEVLVNPYHSP